MNDMLREFMSYGQFLIPLLTVRREIEPECVQWGDKQQYFLHYTAPEKKADTIVKNIINLSRELGMTSLTEGVETHIQYTGLSEMGCRLFQGYYFSKPISVEQFEELLDEKKHEEISQ